jgi:hypothetical protein
MDAVVGDEDVTEGEVVQVGDIHPIGGPFFRFDAAGHGEAEEDLDLHNMRCVGRITGQGRRSRPKKPLIDLAPVLGQA